MQIDRERKRATARVESISLSMETVKAKFSNPTLCIRHQSLAGSKEKITRFLTNEAIQEGSGKYSGLNRGPGSQ